MSIRDIIEAATPGPWFEDAPGDGNRLFIGNRADGRTQGLWEIVHMSGDRMRDLTEEAEQRRRADARFIATFDPKHVALMEAVCEAADDMACAVANGVALGDNAVQFMDEDSDYFFIEKSLVWKLDAPLSALTAYRKERGL